MHRHLFLTGRSGEGKTYLLSQCLMPYRGQVGGFFCQRLTSAGGETVGFRLCGADEPWEPVKPYEEGLSNVFIMNPGDSCVRSPEVFDGEGVRLLKESQGMPICLMDEIGGIEMKAPLFLKALYEAFGGSAVCVGVLKSAGNLHGMSQHMKLSGSLHEQRMLLEQRITEEFSSEIICYERKNYDEVKRAVDDFLSAHTGGRYAEKQTDS